MSTFGNAAFQQSVSMSGTQPYPIAQFLSHAPGLPTGLAAPQTYPGPPAQYTHLSSYSIPQMVPFSADAQSTPFGARPAPQEAAHSSRPYCFPYAQQQQQQYVLVPVMMPSCPTAQSGPPPFASSPLCMIPADPGIPFCMALPRLGPQNAAVQSASIFNHHQQRAASRPTKQGSTEAERAIAGALEEDLSRLRVDEKGDFPVCRHYIGGKCNRRKCRFLHPHVSDPRYAEAKQQHALLDNEDQMTPARSSSPTRSWTPDADVQHSEQSLGDLAVAVALEKSCILIADERVEEPKAKVVNMSGGPRGSTQA